MPPVTNVPNAWITSPASPFARISLVEAIDKTRRNIVPIRIIEGNEASSRGFCTNKENINKTTPKAMFNEIEKFIIQLGTSINKIKISAITKSAIKTSLTGLFAIVVFVCAIYLFAPLIYSEGILYY